MTQDNKFFAIILAVLGFSCFAITDAAYKWQSDVAAVTTNIFLVSLGAIVLILLYGAFSGKRANFWHHPQRKMHIIRGCLIGIHIPVLVYVFSNLPLAQAYTIFFTAPFFVALIGKFFLKERLSMKTLAVIILGFGGVFIAYQPSIVDLQNPYLLAAFAGAILGAVTNIFARYIGQHENNSYSYAVYTIVPVTIVSGFLHFLFNYDMPSSGLYLYPFMTVIWIIGVISIPISFSKAPASYVAPIQYSQIIWGVGLGWALFGDKPDVWAVIGIAVIILSGIILLWQKEPTNRV